MHPLGLLRIRQSKLGKKPGISKTACLKILSPLFGKKPTGKKILANNSEWRRGGIFSVHYMLSNKALDTLILPSRMHRIQS